MRIHNVRLGFACNSSSSHSLIFLPGAVAAGVHDDLIEAHDVAIRCSQSNRDGTWTEYKRWEPTGDWEFGWEHFTAASDYAKRQYVALTLRYNLRAVASPEIARLVAQEWADVPLVDMESYGEDGYIDHESVITLPKSWDEKGLDEEFAARWVDYMLQENLIICGGNDNEEDTHPLVDHPEARDASIGLPRDNTRSIYVTRYDEKFGYWTLFDRGTGNKLRVSFDQPQGFEVERASTPELVDLKITERCPFDCAWCYQDSTSNGKHMDDYYRWVMILREMRVFEVALGGGEPTFHPKFLEIISAFRHNGIIPNFTTRSLHWLRDPKMWRPILNQVGSFAVSVTSAEEVNELAALMKTIGMGGNDDAWFGQDRVSVQYVLGSTRCYDLRWIAEACFKHHIKLTLLGYKRSGRGAVFKPEDYKDWMTYVIEAHEGHYAHVNIDTALAAEFEDALKAEGVPEYLFHTTEGSFSMYIDGVRNACGPSSYCTETEMVPYEPGYNEKGAPMLTTIFQTFHGWEQPLPTSKMDLLMETE